MSSVCPSVTLVDCDHTCWNSSVIISPLVISLGCSLSAGPNIRGLLQREHPEILAQSWFERRRHSIANCGRMVTDSATVRAYRKPPSLFRMVPSLTPYDLPFPRPKWGFHMPPRYANGHISPTCDPIHFFMFGSRVGFSESADRMALLLLLLL